MSINVYILTTQGPVRIQRIAAEQTGVQSVICLDGRAQALPISSRYDAFVRNPTGVIERATGHSAYRVDVDGNIDNGDSWQLAIFVAHLTASIERDDEIHVFATGEVDRDLEVRAVGHVAEKLNKISDIATTLNAEGAMVHVFVPAEETSDILDTNGLHITPVSNVDDVFDVLDISRQPISGPAVSSSNSDQRTESKSPRFLALAFMVPIVFVGWFSWLPLSWMAVASEGKLYELEKRLAEEQNALIGKYQRGLFFWFQEWKRPSALPLKLNGIVRLASTPADCSVGKSYRDVGWSENFARHDTICQITVSARQQETPIVLVGRMAYWPKGLGQRSKPERTMRGSRRLNGRDWKLEFKEFPTSRSMIRIVMITGAVDPVGQQPWFSELLSFPKKSTSFLNAKARVERLGYAVEVRDWQRP